MNLSDLRKPFAPDKISWRVGSTTKDKTKGMALAYIDARDVQDRLDEVCGIGGWQCRYVPMHDKKTVCEIGINTATMGDRWIWKADGAGDSDVEAEKGALSDAFKRAAVKWGIGRYLYDLDSPWVELESAGNSYKIAQKEYGRLRALLGATAPKRSDPVPPPPHADPKQIRKTPRQAQQEIEAIADAAALQAWEDQNSDWLVRLQPVMPGPHKLLIESLRAKHEALHA